MTEIGLHILMKVDMGIFKADNSQPAYQLIPVIRGKYLNSEEYKTS